MGGQAPEEEKTEKPKAQQAKWEEGRSENNGMVKGTQGSWSWGQLSWAWEQARPQSLSRSRWASGLGPTQLHPSLQPTHPNPLVPIFHSTPTSLPAQSRVKSFSGWVEKSSVASAPLGSYPLKPAAH